MWIVADGHPKEQLILYWRGDKALSVKKNIRLPEFDILGWKTLTGFEVYPSGNNVF